MDKNSFCTMPTAKDETVAWNIWHITRIEDLTANILIAKSDQVLNEEWLKRLNTNVKDTGNATSDEEIIKFSNEIVMDGTHKIQKRSRKKDKENYRKLAT